MGGPDCCWVWARSILLMESCLLMYVLGRNRVWIALLYKPGDCLQSQAGRFKKVRTEKTQSHFTMVSFFFFFFFFFFFSRCFVSLPVTVFDSGPPILQADFTEELEPLFDYSRVQPLNVISLLDDDDEPDSPPSKKAKTTASNPAVEKVDESAKVTVIEEDEEDWLIPAPKVTRPLGEDSILKALRLQKQELASFAESAENVVRAVEESVRQELLSSVQTSPDATAAPPPKPQVERDKVVISIQDKDECKQFRVYMDDKLDRVFKLYADKVKLDIRSLVFRFDGDKIAPDATPRSLGMEDEDIIEVHDTSNQKGVSSTKATR
ncbi:hypothetical protein ACLB2K_036766 [Fragaria x ananassa]